MVRQSGLLLARISGLTGHVADSLSSFGGEGQGEEAVVLSQVAKLIGAATRWKVTTNRSIENHDGPPVLLWQIRFTTSTQNPSAQSLLAAIRRQA